MIFEVRQRGSMLGCTGRRLVQGMTITIAIRSHFGQPAADPGIRACVCGLIAARVEKSAGGLV